MGRGGAARCVHAEDEGHHHQHAEQPARQSARLRRLTLFYRQWNSVATRDLIKRLDEL